MIRLHSFHLNKSLSLLPIVGQPSPPSSPELSHLPKLKLLFPWNANSPSAPPNLWHPPPSVLSLWTWLFKGPHISGEGNGTPLQYSCLENPRDGGAWWAAVHGVAKSRTRLSDFTFTFHFQHGNPLQCSCLKNSRDGGAWWVAIYGVAQSQTQLKWLSSSSSSSI